MLARCDGEAKYYPITDLLFDQQSAWAFSKKPLDALQQMMRQAGFSKEKFESLLAGFKSFMTLWTRCPERGEEKFKVSSTPTLFINGQRVSGNMSIDELEKILKPLLGV